MDFLIFVCYNDEQYICISSVNKWEKFSQKKHLGRIGCEMPEKCGAFFSEQQSYQETVLEKGRPGIFS